MTAPASEGSAEATDSTLDPAEPAPTDDDVPAGAAAAAAEAVGESPADLEEQSERAADRAQIAALTAERDEYLDQLQRQRAEFQNFRRRIESDRRQQIAAGVSRLVESLLPVLDGCDAASAQGHSEVAAVGQALMVALSKAGLERIDAVGEPFDPTQHEAVTVEPAPPPADSAVGESVEGSADAPADDAPADGAAGGAADPHQVVTAELRSGFRFEGRVLRAAMVQVRTA